MTTGRVDPPASGPDEYACALLSPAPAASLAHWGPLGLAGLTALLRTHTTWGFQPDTESTQATARPGWERPPQTTTLALCCRTFQGENE